MEFYKNFDIDEFIYLYETFSLITSGKVSIEKFATNLFNQSNN